MILSPLRRKDIYNLTFTTSNYIMMMPYYLGQLWTHLIIKSVDKCALLNLIFLLDFIAIRCQECQKGELKMCRDCDADNGVPKEGAPIICSRRTGSC